MATKTKRATAKKKAAAAKKATKKKTAAKPKKAAKKRVAKKSAPKTKAKATQPRPTPAKAKATKPAASKPRRSLALEVDPDVLEFIEAIDTFKKEHSRPFPTWSEILHIVRELGYRKR